MKKNNSTWISIFEDKPKENGLYYVFLGNVAEGSCEIRKSRYKDGQWSDYFDEHTKILAFKPVSDTMIKNKLEWFKEHEEEIKKAFILDEVEYKCFEIVESFTECISEYECFIHAGRVQYIDKVYVIKVLY